MLPQMIELESVVIVQVVAPSTPSVSRAAGGGVGVVAGMGAVTVVGVVGEPPPQAGRMRARATTVALRMV